MGPRIKLKREANRKLRVWLELFDMNKESSCPWDVKYGKFYFCRRACIKAFPRSEASFANHSSDENVNYCPCKLYKLRHVTRIARKIYDTNAKRHRQIPVQSSN